MYVLFLEVITLEDGKEGGITQEKKYKPHVYLGQSFFLLSSAHSFLKNVCMYAFFFLL